MSFSAPTPAPALTGTLLLTLCMPAETNRYPSSLDPPARGFGQGSVLPASLPENSPARIPDLLFDPRVSAGDALGQAEAGPPPQRLDAFVAEVS